MSRRVVHVILLLSLLSIVEGRLKTYNDLLPQCLEKSTKYFSTHNFLKAQKELDPLRMPESGGKVGPVPWSGTFYNTDWGSNLYNISGSPIAYTVIFKVNSENIHNSLVAQDFQHQLDPINFRSDWKRYLKRYRSASLHELKEKHVHNFGAMADLRTFAFVRDPLDHFVSGLAESFFRGLGFGPHPQLIGSKRMEEYNREVHKNVVDMNTTKSLVQSLIFGQNHAYLRRKLKQWKHFYPQFFAIRKWQPKFIGYLDNFDADWAAMQDKLNIRVQYSSLLTHPTQSDLFGLKKTLRRLFSEDPRYLRAMCHLLIRDYICLGFALPEPCADMYDTYGVDFTAILASNSYN